jgi:transcription-repair coupling factor (superfamily II helicase)
MLNKAVKSLKAGKEPDLMSPMHATMDISLGTPALLPEAYCPDVHERLSLYKRLANAQNESDLSALNEELVDRFGDTPPQAQSLIETHRLRLQMEQLGIKKMDANPSHIMVQFIPNPPIDPLVIIQLIQTNKHIQLNGQDRIKILPKTDQSFESLQHRIDTLKSLIATLSKSSTSESNMAKTTKASKAK